MLWLKERSYLLFEIKESKLLRVVMKWHHPGLNTNDVILKVDDTTEKSSIQ